MKEQRPIPCAEDLLRHQASIRALALSLVRDAGAAEDVVQEARVEVCMVRAGSVRLRVYDARGNLLRFGEIVLRDATGRGPAFRFDYAQAQGTAFSISTMYYFAQDKGTSAHLSTLDGTIRGLPPGTYTLTVKDKTREKMVSFTIAAGEEGSLEVRLGE